MSASIVDLHIVKGKTLELALFVGEEERVMKPIPAITNYAPVTLTVVGHGLVDDWEIEISGIQRPNSLNTDENAPSSTCGGSLRVSAAERAKSYRVRVVDADTITLFNVNGTSLQTYTSGGVVEFNKPSDLTGCEARAQLRRRTNDVEEVLSFYSSGLDEYDAAGGVVEVDVANSRYILRLPAAVAETLPVCTGVWDAEYITADDGVYSLVAVSPFSITGEVTRG